MNTKPPFAAAAGETTGAGFVPSKTLADLKPAASVNAAPTAPATTTMFVSQGGWAMEVTVPKLSAEAAHQRTLEVHAAARERNARNDALRRAKLATKTFG